MTNVSPQDIPGPARAAIVDLLRAELAAAVGDRLAAGTPPAEVTDDLLRRCAHVRGMQDGPGTSSCAGAPGPQS